MKKATVFAACVLVLCLLVLGLKISHAAGTVEIKFAHVDPADVFTSKKGAAGVTFKNIVEAEDPSLAVQLFPAGQIGGERELIEATKLGTTQMSMVSAAIATYFKEAQILDIPYLFSSAPVAWKVMDGWFGKELADECLKKTGMRVLAYGETGFRNFTSSKAMIKSPDEMKGMKIRVMESPIYVNMIKALGAAPTPIPWPETYTALQQKVVDGQENPVSVIMQAKFFEVQKYLTLDGHSYGVDFILINDKFFQSLPAESRMVIKRAAVIAGWAGRSIQQINSAIGVGQLKEKGMEIYRPTDQQLAQFRGATQKPVIDYLETQVSKEWISKLMKAVQEAEAELAK
jgi:tripartite ATP-independent transporter DctP family solute receptor